MSRNLIFITICEQNGTLYDYPKNLPIPRIGETVLFKDISGTVVDIRHIIVDTVSEIKIVVKRD